MSNMERKVIKEGFLRKSPPEKKMDKTKFRKRYFKLWDDKQLEYYKKPTEKRYLKKPIDLSTCLGIFDVSDDYKKYFKNTFKWPFCLQVPTRDYYLIAISDEERTNWKEMISEVCSSNFGPSIKRPDFRISMTLDSRTSTNSSGSSRIHDDQYSSDSSGQRPKSESSSMHYNELPPPRPADVGRPSFENTYDASPGSVSNMSHVPSGYDILPPTLPSDHVLPLSPNINNYNVPPPSPNANYDILPKSTRKKQSTTKYSNPNVTDDLGYVHMDARTEFHKNEEYIKMHGISDDLGSSRGSVKEFKPIGSALYRVSSSTSSMTCTNSPMSPKFNSSGLFDLQNEVFDEIPNVCDNRSSQGNIADPPAVDRNAKPLPTVDRTTKPRMDSEEPEEVYVNATSENISSYLTGCSFSKYDENVTGLSTPLTSNQYANFQTDNVTSSEQIGIPYNSHTTYYRNTNTYCGREKARSVMEDDFNYNNLSSLCNSNSQLVGSCKNYNYTTVDKGEHKVLAKDAYKNMELPSLPNETTNETVEKPMELPFLPNKITNETVEETYSNVTTDNILTSDYENVEIANNSDDEENYQNVPDVDINQNHWESSTDELSYIQVKRNGRKVNTKQQRQPSDDFETDYTRIDPLKSEAARDLR